MITKENEEQALCLNCGLGCQGLLFSHAKIENTPEDIQHAQDLGFEIIEIKNRYVFPLPCQYYIDQCCSIYYTNERPHVCRDFLCKLIREFRKGAVGFTEAQKIIAVARNKADELAGEIAQSQVLNETYFTAIGKQLKILKKNYQDDAAYRKELGKVIVLYYLLKKFLREYFL